MRRGTVRIPPTLVPYVGFEGADRYKVVHTIHRDAVAGAVKEAGVGAFQVGCRGGDSLIKAGQVGILYQGHLETGILQGHV